MELKGRGRRATVSLLAVPVCYCLAARLAEAQTETPSPQAPPPSAQSGKQNKQTPYPTQLNLELHATPEDAKRILSSVDGLLNFSSEHSGLPVHSHVQGQLIDRKGVKEKKETELSKADVMARLERSALVLKKLGLVPRDLDLRSFMLDTTNDPLAGFYDPATKIFYMLDWVPVEAQLPVMAHELTHALQDQYVGLEKWMKIAAAGGEDDSWENGRDEPAIARRAAAEGQATAVMVDYILAPYGRTLADAPSIDADTIQGILQRGTQPALLRAPRYIRESAVFPYTYGLAFIYEVLKKGGKERAFAAVLKNPPENTHQVMHPTAYLAGERIAPLIVPQLQTTLGSNYERLDQGTFGEFDALMFGQQYSSYEKARQISTQWRGGYYYAGRLQKVKTEGKSDASGTADSKPAASPASEAKPIEDPGSVALFLLSRWTSPVAARQFADLYASSVTQRYASATGRRASAKVKEAGERVLAWDTPEGPVSIETRGPLVLVMESFDDAIASKLRSAAWIRTELAGRLESPQGSH